MTSSIIFHPMSATTRRKLSLARRLARDDMIHALLRYRYNASITIGYFGIVYAFVYLRYNIALFLLTSQHASSWWFVISQCGGVYSQEPLMTLWRQMYVARGAFVATLDILPYFYYFNTYMLPSDGSARLYTILEWLTVCQISHGCVCFSRIIVHLWLLCSLHHTLHPWTS